MSDKTRNKATVVDNSDIESRESKIKILDNDIRYKTDQLELTKASIKNAIEELAKINNTIKSTNEAEKLQECLLKEKEEELKNRENTILARELSIKRALEGIEKTKSESNNYAKKLSAEINRVKNAKNDSMKVIRDREALDKDIKEFNKKYAEYEQKLKELEKRIEEYDKERYSEDKANIILEAKIKEYNLKKAEKQEVINKYKHEMLIIKERENNIKDIENNISLEYEKLRIKENELDEKSKKLYAFENRLNKLKIGVVNND